MCSEKLFCEQDGLDLREPEGREAQDGARREIGGGTKKEQ